MATTYVVRTGNAQGFDSRSSDTMAYTHALVTDEGGAYSWHTSYTNAERARQSAAGRVHLTVKTVEKHDGTKATVTRRLATTAPKEAAMASTTAPEPTTATLDQLLPGQTFEFNGQRLRMVKVGAASFRAEGDQGTVATYKANTAKRRVQLVAEAPKADFSGQALLDQLADEGAAKAPKAEAPKPKATRAPKASNLPAQGTLIEDGAGGTYTVRWIHGHDVLAKRTSGGAAKWLVICEHGTQQYADSASHGDKVAQKRATWCATCAK